MCSVGRTTQDRKCDGGYQIDPIGDPTSRKKATCWVPTPLPHFSALLFFLLSSFSLSPDLSYLEAMNWFCPFNFDPLWFKYALIYFSAHQSRVTILLRHRTHPTVNLRRPWVRIPPRLTRFQDPEKLIMILSSCWYQSALIASEYHALWTPRDPQDAVWRWETHPL